MIRDKSKILDEYGFKWNRAKKSTQKFFQATFCRIKKNIIRQLLQLKEIKTYLRIDFFFTGFR